MYGRVRLQKMFYLLDRIGLGSELDYEYHYYGPYSAELTEQIKDAVAFGFIEETPARRASDGVPYSVFGRPTVELGESLGRWIDELPSGRWFGCKASQQRCSSSPRQFTGSRHAKRSLIGNGSYSDERVPRRNRVEWTAR